MVFEFSMRLSGAMGHFVAVLIKEGIDFEVRNLVDGWRITLTGGF